MKGSDNTGLPRSAGAPWVHWLPAPWDATIAVLTGPLAEGLAPDRVRVSVLEGASVYVAARMACPGIEFVIDAIATPDPRSPIRDHEPLWTWNGLDPRPVLATPSPALQIEVGVMAQHPFSADRWLSLGGGLVPRWQPAEVLAVATSPGPPPAGPNQLTWLWWVQHAVAFILAAYPGSHEDDAHFRALSRMAATPNDWLAIAAIAATTARADQDRHVRAIGIDMVHGILESPPDQGDWVTALPAFQAALRLDPEDRMGFREASLPWI